MRAVLYARVSTEAQGQSGLGLSAQRKTTRRATKAKGWKVVAEVHDVASGKSLKKRPALEAAIRMIERDEADVLMVAKLDRASRSVTDFGHLLNRLKKAGGAFVALDLGVDTSTPGGRLVANVIVSVAEWEVSVISERTKAAIRARPRDGMFGEDVRARAKVLRAKGLTLCEVADKLYEEGVRPVRGGSQLYASTVAGLLAD